MNKPKRKLPPKWTDIYPQGTKIGDEEQRFFIALERNAKWTFVNTDALAKEAKLTPIRIEEICNKYLKFGVVIQNPKDENQWGYWERNLDLLEPDEKSICSTDQEKRIDDTLNTSSPQVVQIKDLNISQA